MLQIRAHHRAYSVHTPIWVHYVLKIHDVYHDGTYSTDLRVMMSVEFYRL